MFSIYLPKPELFKFTTTIFLPLYFFFILIHFYCLLIATSFISSYKTYQVKTKVKCVNANINNFKMFSGTIKMQQFHWQRKIGWSYPQPSLFTTSCRWSGFNSPILCCTFRLETFIELISSLCLSSPSFLQVHATVHGWLQWMSSHTFMFITLCPLIGVASVVTVELLIRIIKGGRTHHFSLF